MKLLDSCVWMEVIAGSALGLRFKKLATDKQNILMSSLVQFEVRRWALRELTESRADDVVTALREVIFVQTTEPIALLAADLARQHKLHAMDALIYATALGTTPSWSPATRISKVYPAWTTCPKLRFDALMS